ncbi:MAG: nicotinate phosphoribosyltransferase [Gammaproteobacteria bacterium]|jgi:nicotinate phosphoribosyltransferase
MKGALGSVLLTDLYQLTMLDAYRQTGMNGTAVFEMFVRRLPASRGFLMAAGLEQALDYLESLRFEESELEWLAGCGHFDPEFVDWLADLRFEGDVWAMREGEVFFANEPMLRVEAPITQAQLVESRLINILHFQSLIATKAARVVMAAGGRTLVDFGMRRAHGAEAAVWAARASYGAGFDGSATVEAGRQFGLPIFGTMAHSYVQAHDSEEKAFLDFARSRPDGLVLLIDTYDVEAAVAKVVRLADILAEEDISIRAVRLDSGDLAAGSRLIRRLLDEAGRHEIGIFLSGNLDEHQVADLVARDVPVTGFGVGTRLDVSADAPALDIAYKLQEYDGKPRRKRSAGKATWPGRKQVFRSLAPDGTITADRICAATEEAPGKPLLAKVMKGGRRLEPAPSLQDIRDHAAAGLSSLPEACRRLRDPRPLQAEVSETLRGLAVAVDQAVEA